MYNKLLQHNFKLIDSGQKPLEHFELVTFTREQALATGIASDLTNEVCKRVNFVFKRWVKSEKLKLDFWYEHGCNTKPLNGYLKKSGLALIGKPRFKTKGISIAFSVRRRDQSSVRVFGKQTSVNIPLIGRVKGHNDRQPILGDVKFVTIKKDCCGTFWAGITCDGDKPKTKVVSRSRSIGVDLGLKHLITAANDVEVIQPIRDNYLDRRLRAIKRASNQDRRALPFIYRKISKRRKHLHHVLAKQLIVAADNIYVGDLNSKWLFSGQHARSALDAAHFQFKQILARKAENADKLVVIVNEAGSTITCYKCNHKKEMKLSDREFTCPNCGYRNDRDINGALNIMKTGESLRLKAQESLEVCC